MLRITFVWVRKSNFIEYAITLILIAILPHNVFMGFEKHLILSLFQVSVFWYVEELFPECIKSIHMIRYVYDEVSF